MLRKQTLAAALFLLGASSFSSAQDLTEAAASSFIDSLQEVNEYAENLPAQVRESALNSASMPEAGQPFTPYSGAVAQVKESHGDVYDDMEDIVEDYGFDSLEDWGTTGDRVTVAYMAMQMEGNEMAQITPEMLQQVPEQMRPEMERMLALMETVRNAPAADVATVRPLAPRLEAFVNEAANAAAADGD